MHVGEIIKRIRKEKNMTLLELSNESGVALATLSRIENGKMTGTLGSHMNICKAFEITLPDLYKELPSSKKTLDVRHKNAKESVYVHDTRSSAEILAPNALNKKMMPMLIRISKGGQTSNEENRPGTEKFIYIVEGKAEAFIGDNCYKLSKGDTLYFESSPAHYFKNTGSGEILILSVTAPPTL